MPQMTLLVSTPNQEDSPNKCPFCNKPEHAFPGKEADSPDYTVVSNPNALACSDMSNYDEPYPWAMARHHLISAKQCFARLKRIVRMAKMTAYDINSKPNGIGLPTISSKTTYPTSSGGTAKYGKFPPEGKSWIAYQVMETAKAQWHVGHHSHKLEVDPGYEWGEENSTATEGHLVKYDVEIVKRLIDIMKYWQKNAGFICDAESEADSGEKFIDSMNDLSQEIADKLNHFQSDEPWQSDPLYVSRLAYDFAYSKRKAKYVRNRSHTADSSTDTPASPSKRKKNKKT